MTLLILCWEFLKAGLFSVGGGMAILPFLTQMSVNHPEWFSREMLANMVAVSESTPGPIGANMATYVGYTVAGVPGAILVTLTLLIPSVIIVLIVSKFLTKYKENKLVQDSFKAIRPAVAGLIIAAGYSVLEMSIFKAGQVGFFNMFSWPAVALFVVLLIATQIKPIKKLHPIVFIAVGAVAGILINF